jgi:PAS domain-containing protein
MIGNYCESIYLYKKVSDFILTVQEKFTFMRLKFNIAKVLKEKLRPSNEQVVSLEYLDVSQYYKYDSLSQNFLNEISNDINLSLEFWKAFRAPLKDITKKIDFNKVFKLTDKIRISKKRVEIMWNELLSIYGGVNEFFELYSNYVVEINDDDLKKRDLDSIRRKNDNYNEHLNQNFYGVLFNKDTGIIIANGDKGSEGLIELSNREIEKIFKYKPNDIKGKNLANLMPKIFVQDHSKFMQRYFRIGEKKLLTIMMFIVLEKIKIII